MGLDQGTSKVCKAHVIILYLLYAPGQGQRGDFTLHLLGILVETLGYLLAGIGYDGLLGWNSRWI